MKSIGNALLAVLLLACIAVSTNIYSQEDDKSIAQIIFIKGEAHAKLPNEKIVALKKGVKLEEGAVVKTAAKSIVKILFIDKSTLNVGPESQIKITKFADEKAGVIDLIRGSIRSKVSKDYMKIKEKDSSKLIVKTKSAAMGVRGTDFTVNFEEKSESTRLQVWEGDVVFISLTNELKAKMEEMIDQKTIDKEFNQSGIHILSGEQSEALKDQKKELEKSSIPEEKMQMYQEEQKKQETIKEDKVVREIHTPVEQIKEIENKQKETLTHEKVTPEFRPLPPSAEEINKAREVMAQNPEFKEKMEKMSDKETQLYISEKIIEAQKHQEIQRHVAQEMEMQRAHHKDSIDDQRRMMEMLRKEELDKTQIQQPPPPPKIDSGGGYYPYPPPP